MTQTLRSVLHDRARAVDPDPLDLDALMGLGERRLRRRRVLRTASGAAAVVTVASVALLVTTGGPGARQALDPSGAGDRVADPATPVDTDVVVWSRGSVLHTPEGTHDVGVPVAALVRTSVGYVVADRSGGVFAVDADSVERVGSTTTGSGTRLVADPGGPYAAWLDPGGSEPTFVVLDQARGTEQRDARHTGPTTPTGPEQDGTAVVLGLDDQTLYLAGDDGTVGVDLGSGATTPVPIDPESAPDLDGLVGAGGGLLAITSTEPYGLRVGAPGRASTLVPDVGGPTYLSQDGRFLSVDADSPEVYDVRTRERVDLDLDHAFATGYDWLADGRLVVLAARAARDDAQAQLLTCRPETGSCILVARDVGSFEELVVDGAFPGGRTLE